MGELINEFGQKHEINIEQNSIELFYWYLQDQRQVYARQKQHR